MAPHKRTTMFAAAALGAGAATVALCPGIGFASPAQPGPAQPGPAQPGSAQLGSAQLGSARLGSAQSAADRPGSPQAAETAAKAQISQLYQQAEAATQSYDAAQEQIGKIQTQLAGEGAEAAGLRGRLSALSSGLGRLAAQQYRSSGVDPTVALMFAAHPDTYLAQSELISQSVSEQQRELQSVQSDQQALDTLDELAGRQLTDLRAQQAVLAANRTAVQGRLAAAHHQLDLLTASERITVAAALARGDNGDGLGTTVPADAPSLASLLSSVADTADADDSDPEDDTRVLKAISAAYAELGKPYVWGATGPDDFDCSGLTQHVWAAAGVALPRTSEEQADIGADIPLDQIEPGDLVIYFSGRTHVGVYVGQGLVIHAPRPGSVVQFTTLSSMPINKVVRPMG